MRTALLAVIPVLAAILVSGCTSSDRTTCSALGGQACWNGEICGSLLNASDTVDCCAVPCQRIAAAHGTPMQCHSLDVIVNPKLPYGQELEIDGEKLEIRKEEMEAEKKAAEHFIGEEIEIQMSDLCVPKVGHLEGDSNDSPWNSGQKEETRREIERTKIKLEDSEGIGEDVMKEYNQVKARDDFFEKELGDLGKAASSLVELMRDLAEKIDRDFQKGAEEINKEFQNFFAVMFGGGEASLKIVKTFGKKSEDEGIEEREDIFIREEDAEREPEEGIEISVNIPRKRIRSLEMLSGGERALTSIALLFAMTQVNPPPFLVLDETDAALDESNSQKYAKMLKDLSKKTQLIIVTHNRETMKQAGLLYGVTLGSAGISQILSIKFGEAEELAAQDK